MIKTIVLALLINLIIVPCFGQDRKDLAVSILGGRLASPYYKNNTLGKFFSIDFNYYLSTRHILSVNYIDGGHNYFDNTLSTDLTSRNSDGTNAKAGYHTFSVLYKYKFLHSKQVNGAIGTGAGIMTHSRRYPILTAYGSSFGESVWTDLVFPVRLEIDYSLLKNFKIGVAGGFFVHPDFPILAYHVGPRISYVIK